ncbi:hypothetical protein AB0392_06915 [Nonomuraea angiospora]
MIVRLSFSVATVVRTSAMDGQLDVLLTAMRGVPASMSAPTQTGPDGR